MSNDPIASLNPPASSFEAEYETLRATLAETARGRRFLEEYVRRNHPTDTESGLAAIQRMEAALHGSHPTQSFDRFRFDVIDMAEAIARTKAEIAAIKPDAERYGKIEDATEELDSIVNTTEAATSRILAAAEQVQEIAWTLREQGVDKNFCDQLDAQATETYTACSFQDLTGQRTRKVIQVLRYLEDRINAMISIWGVDIAPVSVPRDETSFKDPLANGPSPPGVGLAQADVDIMMEPHSAPTGERRDASIEDIGRVMMALEPVVVAGVAESASVPDQPLAKEDAAQNESAQATEPRNSAAASAATEPAMEMVAAASPGSILDRMKLPASFPTRPLPEPDSATASAPAPVELTPQAAVDRGSEPGDFLFAAETASEVSNLGPADFLLEPAPAAPPPQAQLSPIRDLEPDGASGSSRPAGLFAAAQLENIADRGPPIGATQVMPEPSSERPPPVSHSTAQMQHDPLAALRALSDEEKIALFS
jgi:chemotaxis regulatin CheY-phosphate phosphatase CheZ